MAGTVNKNDIELLTRNETAGVLRSCVRKVDYWTKSGELRAVRLGTRVLYAVDDIQKFIDKKKDSPK